MKTTIALSTLGLAAGFAGAAFAQASTSDMSASGRTRDEVNAEVAAYQKARVNPWATSYNPLKSFQSTRTRDDVNADLAAYQKSGVNPWATSYNPLASFQSTKTRAEVTADYLASRDEVNALTGEDSGSAYLAHLHTPAMAMHTHLAGTPANAQ